MAINLKKRPIIREKKLKATNAYLGKIDQLIDILESDELKQRVRTFSQTSVDEIIYTLDVINGIKDSVIIIHGPSGCSSAQLNFYLRKSGRPWIVTNLNENDSILGADAKLREAVSKAYKDYKASSIFIVSTPVVGINNDDIQSIIFELEEEVGVPIIPIYSDGFKSKISAYGYDLALHSVAKYILPSSEKTETENYINVISVSESDKQLKALVKILEDLNVNYNIITRDSDIEDIRKSVNAKATITVDNEAGNFLAEVLRENYDVPYIKTDSPIGIKATNKWILDIAKELEIEEKANEYISKNLKTLEQIIVASSIVGKKVYINQLPTIALQLASLIEELNGEVVGVTVEYIDDISTDQLRSFKDKFIEGKIHVSTGQVFEVINIVKKYDPDVYIGKAWDSIWISKLGIKAIALDNEELYGYEGVAKLLKQFLKVFKNSNLEVYLKDNLKLPYHENWLGKSANWYIKQEVK